VKEVPDEDDFMRLGQYFMNGENEPRSTYGRNFIIEDVTPSDCIEY